MQPMLQRVNKELSILSHLGTDSLIGVLPPNPATPTELQGWVKGPDDTPYEEGVWIIDIVLPDKYPFKPPKMTFKTHIWHPNVSSVTGAICLDTLKDEWTPALTIRTALLSILALFTAANPTDPQDHVVAKQYMTEPAAFSEKAREWTEKYASANLDLYKGPRYKTGKAIVLPNTVVAAPVSNAPFKYQRELTALTEMGYDPRQARSVLESCNGSIDDAIVKFQTL